MLFGLIKLLSLSFYIPSMPKQTRFGDRDIVRSQRDSRRIAERRPKGRCIEYHISEGNLKEAHMRYESSHKIGSSNLVEALNKELKRDGGLPPTCFIYEVKGTNGKVLSKYELQNRELYRIK